MKKTTKTTKKAASKKIKGGDLVKAVKEDSHLAGGTFKKENQSECKNIDKGKKLIEKALQTDGPSFDDAFFLLKLNLFQQNIEYIYSNMDNHSPLAIKMCKALAFALQYWMEQNNVGYTKMNKEEEELFQFLLDREKELIMNTEEAA